MPLLLAILALQMISVVWAWEIERPGDEINIKEIPENAYTNGEASVGLGVGIDDYDEGATEYGGDDYVALNVSMTANSRKGITYTYDSQSFWWIPENELSCRSDRVGVGDDVVAAVDIPQGETPFAFRFYGGRGSAEYRKVYVSTNGFISFHNSTQPSPTPLIIPCSAEPNAIIAAVWTDLKIDSSASIITGLWVQLSKYYFVIIWNNALHKASEQRLTFQIILEDASYYYPVERRFSQSRIWISYKSVSPINTDFTIGIEDQQGYKGLGGLSSGSSLGNLNGETRQFYQYSNSFFLKRLTLSFQDANSQTEFNIWEDNGYYLRGTNIQRNINQPSQPDETYMFAKTLAGTATLLISAFSPSGWIAAAGFIVGTVLVGSDWVDYLAYRQYSGRQVEVLDREDGLQQQANAIALTHDYMVDASLSIIVHWILKTENNVGTHSLTTTATLEYYEYSITDGSIIDKPPITTSVNLKIGPDHNNSPDEADSIGDGTTDRLYIGVYDTQDYYTIYLNEGCIIHVNGNATSSPVKPDFYLFLYDPERNPKANTEHGYSPSISYTADSSGYWFIEARKYENYGFYSLEITTAGGGGGGGGDGDPRFMESSPTLFVWNGSEYMKEVTLDLHGDSDATIWHTIEQLLVPEDDYYLLSLRELNESLSHIDYVKLYIVDVEGEMHESHLTHAIHSELGKVKQLLMFDDDDRVDLGPSQIIDLKFNALEIENTAYFIFEIQGYESN